MLFSNKTIIDNKEKRDDEIYCRLLLNNLFEGYDHIPVTKSSMSFFGISMILNDLIINQRKSILEFGSGLSTILLARLIKKNKIDCKIYSVENDKNWFDLLNNTLHKENTIENVIPVYAPLASSSKSKNNLEWYDESIINTHLSDTLIDLVIIDGPPAHEKTKSLSRYPALPFIIKRLNKDHSIYLDDVSRDGEKNILKFWLEEFQTEFVILNDKLALYSNNKFTQYSCLPC